MYLLDTNIVSHILYRPETHPYLVHKVRTTPQRDIRTSMVTVMELLDGRLQQLKRAVKSGRGVAEGFHNLQALIFEDVQKLGKVLELDEAALSVYRGLGGNLRVAQFDLYIAAIALANDCVLVTANVRDFEKIPNLKIEDWTVRPME